jgi:hypothetical protein
MENSEQTATRDDFCGPQCLFLEATFSDMRIAYHTVSEKFRSETQKSGRSSKEHQIARLLAEFLDDPDIRARWDVIATNDASREEKESRLDCEAVHEQGPQ